MLLRLAASLVILACLALPALADDWVAVKLRGKAESQTGGGVWVTMQRGDIINDTRLVRTLADSRLELQRGKEVVTLGPNSQVSIEDKPGDASTVVHQSYGTVEVEAEVKDVPHFTVQTKYLAAVVKGTHFIVTADDLGASVEVTRGLVAVEETATLHTASVKAGYTASISVGGGFRVTGVGPDIPIFDKSGTPLPAVAASGNGGFIAKPTGDANAGTIKVAANGAPDAGVGILVDLNGANAGATATAEPAPQQGGDWMLTVIGIVIGIGLGSVALLLRNVLS